MGYGLHTTGFGAGNMTASAEGLLPARLRHWLNCIRSSQYRREALEFRKLAAMARYTQTTTSLLGPPFIVPDALSFIHSYREIFRNRLYEFRAVRRDPVILDCGANIGLSVLFFKQLYPDSRILAFEADPQIFRILSANCAACALVGVELVNKAVWTEDAILDFAQEGSDAGRMPQPGEAVDVIRVEACRLRDYLLQQPVDMLKLDIEGAETAVLTDCADALGSVQHVFVEYHSFATEPQTLAALLGVLTDAGFRFHVQTISTCPQPFLVRPAYLGMDLQLNIFAWRPQ